MRIRTGLRMLVAVTASLAVVPGCGSNSMPRITEPTGLIAFTHQDASGLDRIFVIRADGSGRHALTTRDSLDPAWSPDGTKLAFLDHGQNLVVMNADGSGRRIVSREQGIAEDEIASWSPDGTQLVFGAKLRLGADDLSVVNADGTGMRRLGVRGSGPDWSPDGTRIVFNDQGGRVAVIGVDGGGLRLLTQSGCSVDPPRWSPDGKKIAFIAPDDCLGHNDASIEVMNADGTGRHAVTRGGNYGEPAWSADGTHLVFSRGSDLFSLGDLYVADADGGGMRRITSDGGNFGPSWRRGSG